MFRTILPIVAIIIAVGLFFTFIKPTFEDVRAVQDETQDYVEAIDKAGQLRARIDELVAQQNGLSPVDLERLEALLPDTVDEVAVMYDVDALAQEHNMTLAGVGVTDTQDLTDAFEDDGVSGGDPAAGTAQQSAGANARAYTPTEISFTLTGTYESLRGFLTDLEQSLMLMEVAGLSFTESEGDLTQYTITIRVYSFAFSS